MQLIILFSAGNDYNKDKKFIVMIEKNNTFQPILNTGVITHLTLILLMKLKKY